MTIISKLKREIVAFDHGLLSYMLSYIKIFKGLEAYNGRVPRL